MDQQINIVDRLISYLPKAVRTKRTMAVRRGARREERVSMEFSDVHECLCELGEDYADYDIFVMQATLVDGERVMERIPLDLPLVAPQLSNAELRLVADRHEWFLDVYAQMRGKSVGGYSIDTLVDYGADTVVFRATDESGAAFALKIPWDPRSRCSSTSHMAKKRQRIEREASVLKQFGGLCFPAFVQLIYAESLFAFPPMPGKMACLVEEFVEGSPPNRCMAARGTATSDAVRTDVTKRCAAALVDMQMSLLRRNHIYTDVKASNLLLSNAGVRVVDAASVSFLVHGQALSPRITPACLPDRLYRQYIGKPTRFQLGCPGIVQMVGRTLASLLLGQVLIAGFDLDWGRARCADGDFLAFVRALAEGRISSFAEAQKLITKVRHM